MSAALKTDESWWQAVDSHIVRGAPMLASLRLAAGEWLSGTLWSRDLLVTARDALPVQPAYTAVLSDGAPVAAQVLRRDAASNIALLKLVGPGFEASPRQGPRPLPGAPVLVLQAGPAAAGPIGRLSVVQDSTLRLDSPIGFLGEGGPVFDEAGAILGVCVAAPDGHPRLVTCADIAALISGGAAVPMVRGWIGAALQPIRLPFELRSLARQSTGRLVLNVYPGGPADEAGLLPGDVVLAIDGAIMNGRGSLRSLLGPERIGRLAPFIIARGKDIMWLQVRIQSQPSS